MNCGDGACLGCGEKTAIHLFTSTVAALMQPRVKAFVEKLDDLITRLEQHMRVKLASAVNLTDTSAVMRAVNATGQHDLTLSNLAAKLNENKPSQLLDPVWVKNTAQMLEKLKDLRWRYMEGPSKNGVPRWAWSTPPVAPRCGPRTFPFNPYPFPWTSHLFQDSPSWRWACSKATWRKMVEGFKTVRQVEKELAGGY